MGYDIPTREPRVSVERAIVLERIELITQQLWELRRLIDKLLPSEPSDLTSQLLGCLGAEPIEAYDYELDWDRFIER